MQYKVVYEINSIYFSFVYLFPLAFIILFGYLLKLNIIDKKVFGDSSNIISQRYFLIIGAIIVLAINALIIIGYFNSRNTLYKAYKNGDYLVIEGEVEDFHPISVYGHNVEYFYVNDVYFEYSNEVGYGYNKPMIYGGFIKENGQLVRIAYISDSTNNHNIIVKIEISEIITD